MHALARAIAAGERYKRQTRLYDYEPYLFQEQFHNAGAENSERLLMAANGVGKTHCGAAETAIHLTGEYPDWWKGRVFKEPVKFWIGSITNQTQRDYTQPALLGDDLGENVGTGWIPKDKFIGKIRTRQAGIPDVADSFQVRHKSGGISYAFMKTYEQGWRMWQGAAPDGIWCDEQPDENANNEKRIPTEVQTRIFRSGGISYWTLTPLLGETDLIRHFTEAKVEGLFWVGATWDDAPHLAEEDKERLRKSYPEHELEVRTLGVPMMGEGRVFTVSESDIKCDPFDIPEHYARICGIDFGMDHPGAGAWLAWDRDNDIIYVYDCYKQRSETAVYHAAAINKRGNWIPVAWPHDGLNREAGGGEQLYKLFQGNGANMIAISARYQQDKGGRQEQEPIIMEVLERMKTGRFRVFSHLIPWFEEFRSYHRKDGKLVAVKDDILKATFYALMMRRFAATRTIKMRVVQSSPILSSRI